MKTDAGELDRQERRRAASRFRTIWTASTASLWVFTTRADTIMGVTFCAVAAEHPLATRLRRSAIRARRVHRGMQARQRDGGRLATHGKERACRRACTSMHPLTGEEDPEVWVGNYVLMGYGEGAVMGVPGARRARLRVRQEIRLADQAGDRRRTANGIRLTAWQPWYAEQGVCINSGNVRRAAILRAAVDAIAGDLEAKGLGEKQVTWRLRDWGISRQRYWGTPIPIVHCADAAMCRFPTISCRWCCPKTGAGRQRQSTEEACRLPQHVPARSAAGRRSAKPTRWTRSSIRPGITCASPAPTR